MAIKQKIGHCIDCPEDTPAGPIVGKRCRSHYWKYRNEVNAAKGKNKQKAVDKKVMGTFMAFQALTMPKCCEECGEQLPQSPSWMRKACIAHILPKRPDFGFPSVAIHPVNKIFLCIDCHTNMDNLGDVFILKMRMLPVMVGRVAKLIPFLTEQECNRVPEYFLKA